jgi:hypothetical protein
VRVTQCLRGLRVAGAAVLALGAFTLGGLVSSIIGLSGDGTRLFGTREKPAPRWGITIVAYQT